MKIRLSSLPFWSCLWICLFPHFLLLLVPFVNLVELLSGNAEFSEVAVNLRLCGVYLIVTHALFLILFVVWVLKNPKVMVFGPDGGKIVMHRREIARFSYRDVRVVPKYQKLDEILSAGNVYGETDITIWMEDGKMEMYTVGINRITAQRLRNYISQHMK